MGRRGERFSGSPRFFWCCWRGRGGTGSGESTEGSFGGRRRNGDGGGVAGLPEGRGSVGRKEGVEAELVGVSERLGVASGHERARRRRRVCSVAARERARGGEELGERVRGLGGCVASRTGSRATRGSRRWLGGKQEVAEAASASATPRLCSSSWQRRKRTKEEEVGWAGWATGVGPGGALGGLQVGGPGRLLLFFYISVLFSFI